MTIADVCPSSQTLSSSTLEPQQFLTVTSVSDKKTVYFSQRLDILITKGCGLKIVSFQFTLEALEKKFNDHLKDNIMLRLE